MAEALFKNMVKNKENNIKDINVISAGTCAIKGDNASKQAIEVLKEKNIDIKHHRSTPLTLKLIKESDLILTMTYNHKMAVLHMCPESKDKVFTLKEYVLNDGAKSSICDNLHVNMDCDIKDPFGQEIKVYRESAKDIEESLKKLIKKIK